jgi:hypothetical protein
MDYTIIGGGVNLAARLESACAPDEILISYETYAHVKDMIHCEERDKISVKGISQPVTTYQVIDLRENLSDAMQPIRAMLPNFQINIDMMRMSPDEHREALAISQEMVERLSKFAAKAKF